MGALKKRLSAVQTELLEKDEELKLLHEATQHGLQALKAKEQEHKALLEQHQEPRLTKVGGFKKNTTFFGLEKTQLLVGVLEKLFKMDVWLMSFGRIQGVFSDVKS